MSEEIERIFRERLCYRLKELEMSQTNLAKRVGCNDSSISQYLKGDRTPDHRQLSKICDALYVTSDYLLGKTEYGDTRMLDIAAGFKELSEKRQDFLMKVFAFLRHKPENQGG